MKEWDCQAEKTVQSRKNLPQVVKNSEQDEETTAPHGGPKTGDTQLQDKLKTELIKRKKSNFIQNCYGMLQGLKSKQTEEN